MSVYRRLYAAMTAGLLGWFIGKALNVPIWRDWDIGDRSDMALCAALLIIALTRSPSHDPR